MKRILALLLVLSLMVLSFSACSNSESTSAEDVSSTDVATEDVSNTSAIPLDTLIVGTSGMNGDFINNFGNNAFDLAVKTMVNGFLATVISNEVGDLLINDVVVADYSEETDSAGNKTYFITLHEDLKFNNGEPIMASNYVASILFGASPEWVAAGATSSIGDALVGYSEYYDGSTTVFEGVKLLGDYEFSLTVPAEKFPYYWETYFCNVDPIYSGTYYPGATVKSDETGSWFEFEEGDLATATMAVAENERFAPTVTPGPYAFISFENDTVTLERNEYFKSDHNGFVPTIENVVIKAIPQDTNVEWVLSGEVDYVANVVEGEKIEAAKAGDSANIHSYLRAGYGNLSMHTEFGPTADANVRWALGSLIDRTAVVDYVLGGYGGTVDSAYAYAQWMYNEKAADLQAELKPISFNIELANDYLDDTEWVFEEDGSTAFDRAKATEGSGYFRYNAEGEPLVINHAGITDNPVTEIIEIQYAANAPLAGVDFRVTKLDFTTLLGYFYYGYELGDERLYHTFNLATDLSAIDDKYYNWHSDFAGTWQNNNQLSDPELDEIMITMRSVEPSDREGYLNAWFDFQVRWNELLPEIPLYSNEYFDISHKNVDPVVTTPYYKWYNAICEITKSEK